MCSSCWPALPPGQVHPSHRPAGACLYSVHPRALQDVQQAGQPHWCPRHPSWWETDVWTSPWLQLLHPQDIIEHAETVHVEQSAARELVREPVSDGLRLQQETGWLCQCLPSEVVTQSSSVSVRCIRVFYQVLSWLMYIVLIVFLSISGHWHRISNENLERSSLLKANNFDT